MKISKNLKTLEHIKKIKPISKRIKSAKSTSVPRSNYIKSRPRTALNSQVVNSKLSNNRNRSQIENDNLNILDLMIESNPYQYNYKKIKEKYKQITPLYLNNKKSNFVLPNMSKYTKNVLYKYNLLYGNNSQNLIRTYSPKMRPKSSSVKVFLKTIKDSKEDIYIFTEDEILLLIKAKCQDIGIDLRENMYIKFKDFCNSKCKNRVVDLSECYFGLNSIKVLSEILYNSNRIARLDLTKNNIGDRGLEILVNSVKNSLSLLSLNVTSNSITYKGGNIIFKEFVYQQSIIDLNISSKEGRNRNRITFEGLKYLEYFLTENIFIEILNLSGNSIRNEGFILLCRGLKYNQAIINLDVSNNEIYEKGIKQGLEYINNEKIYTKIYSLNISSNNILDGGIISLSNNLRYFPNLHVLNIAFCGIEFNGFKYLLKTIQYIKRIESLNVSGNKLKNKNFDYLKQFFCSFNIKYLNMAKCKLGDKSGSILGECIAVNETLKSVNISGNEITDVGFKSFINIFKNNNSIENFDCSCNFITDHSGKEFVKSLIGNRTLKVINFYDNQLHNEIGNLFIEILETNKNLIHINLNYNRIQVKTIEEINKILKSNYEKQKVSFVPGLLKNIKELEFKPEQFSILSKQIIKKKTLQNFLYKKVRQDDKNFCTRIGNENRKIEKKEKKLNEIKLEIKNLESMIIEKNQNMEINDKQSKIEEDLIKQKIENEKKILDKINEENNKLRVEYSVIKEELMLAFEKTEKNHTIIKDRYQYAKYDYESKNNKYIQKFSYYQDIINPMLLVPIKKTNASKKKSKKNVTTHKVEENNDKKTERNNFRSMSMRKLPVKRDINGQNNNNNLYISTISTGNFNLNNDEKLVNVTFNRTIKSNKQNNYIK